MAKKTAKYLAALTEWIHAKPIIIVKDTTAVITNNNVINDNFKSFDENVYQSEWNNSGTDPRAFLNNQQLWSNYQQTKIIIKKRDNPEINIRYC